MRPPTPPRDERCIASTLASSLSLSLLSVFLSPSLFSLSSLSLSLSPLSLLSLLSLSSLLSPLFFSVSSLSSLSPLYLALFFSLLVSLLSVSRPTLTLRASPLPRSKYKWDCRCRIAGWPDEATAVWVEPPPPPPRPSSGVRINVELSMRQERPQVTIIWSLRGRPWEKKNFARYTISDNYLVERDGGLPVRTKLRMDGAFARDLSSLCLWLIEQNTCGSTRAEVGNNWETEAGS